MPKTPTITYPEIDLDDDNVVRSYADRPNLLEHAMAVRAGIGCVRENLDDPYLDAATAIEGALAEGDEEGTSALRGLVDQGVVSVDRAAETLEEWLIAAEDDVEQPAS